MKIRMRIAVSGTFHGNADGALPGDIIEVDDVIGARYCSHHYAEPVIDRKEERAVAPSGEERSAEEEAPAQKRGPGRPPLPKS